MCVRVRNCDPRNGSNEEEKHVFFFFLLDDDDDNGIDSDRGPLMRRSTACRLQVVLQPDFGR